MKEKVKKTYLVNGLTASYEGCEVDDCDMWVAKVLVRAAIVNFIVGSFLSLLMHKPWACMCIAGYSIAIYGFSLMILWKKNGFMVMWCGVGIAALNWIVEHTASSDQFANLISFVVLFSIFGFVFGFVVDAIMRKYFFWQIAARVVGNGKDNKTGKVFNVCRYTIDDKTYEYQEFVSSEAEYAEIGNLRLVFINPSNITEVRDCVNTDIAEIRVI